MGVIAWTQQTSSFGTTEINDVAYNGSNLWVAVGSSGKLATSPDGETWTQRTSSFGTSVIRSVAHDQTGLWVAVGGTKLATSSDGIIWTQQTSAGNCSKIRYGGGIWIAIGSLFYPVIQTSTNGVDWSLKTHGFSHPMGIAYNGTNLWLVIGDVATNRIESSPDGITWSFVTDITSLAGAGRCIAHNQSNLWICGSESYEIATSPDGSVWTTININTSAIYDIAYNGSNLWAIVGTSGGIESSSDGTTWIIESSGFGSSDINGVVHNQSDLWIVVGEDGKLATGVATAPKHYTSDYDIGSSRKVFWLNRTYEK